MALVSIEREREYKRDWQRKHRAKSRLAGLCGLCEKQPARPGKQSCLKCIKIQTRYVRNARYNARATILSYYGRACACCGETIEKFLTIDHINNDGSIQRSKFASEHCYYANVAKLIKLGKAPTDLRILCCNCNMGRARNGGICPHLSK